MSDGQDAKVYKFPPVPVRRNLTWEPAPYVIGCVEGMSLVARVMPNLSGPGFVWMVSNGGVPVSFGTATTVELGQEAAKRAIEQNVLVVRPTT